MSSGNILTSLELAGSLTQRYGLRSEVVGPWILRQGLKTFEQVGVLFRIAVSQFERLGFFCQRLTFSSTQLPACCLKLDSFAFETLLYSVRRYGSFGFEKLLYLIQRYGAFGFEKLLHLIQKCSFSCSESFMSVTRSSNFQNTRTVVHTSIKSPGIASSSKTDF